MNRRSLKFQLVAWYAGLVTGCFLLLGMAAYMALDGYLVGALKQTQFRRGRQIAQLVLAEQKKGKLPDAGLEVEEWYAPGQNDRFVRIRRGGETLYVSKPPANSEFDPANVPLGQWPARPETALRMPLLGGRELLITRHTVEMPGGAVLIETGALMDNVQRTLRQWLVFLAAGLPVVALLAVAGGYFLVKRALTPVDQIAASAERIGSHNLSERLPVAATGDELERLSVALNHMIERLDAAFQYSRRFVADASHELRTPLTVLRGELEGLVEEPQLREEWRERLGSALEEVERLVNIVEGLFAISRLDAGEAQAEWVKFDLASLAVATADQMSLLAEDKRITVSCAAAADVWVEGDRSRMKQVVVNLLDNAIKYTAEGGSVGLTVSPRGGKAVLEVADNGIGMTPEVLPRVFERFFRVDPARSRAMGGAGLGLSIVKSICGAHQGRVEALSTPGQGSVFRVELPLVAAPIPAKTNGRPNI
jgi:heavy metal sensor kinase